MINDTDIVPGVDPALIARARQSMRARARERGYEPRSTAPMVSLHDFTRAGWSQLEPDRPFIDNWHIGSISEHLTACSYGQIQKLIINIPPGFMKSLLACVFWFSWTWTFRPASRWGFSSYNEDFAQRDSIKSRMLIESEWYQQRYGSTFRLTKTTEKLFHNNRTGFRQAFGVGGGTGGRYDYIVTDDPHKILEAESEVERENVYQWWTETMQYRVTNPATAVHVIIMQRLHDQDLTGKMLAMKELGYEHLMLPMEYEPDRATVTSLGKPDRRTKEGELLFPKLYPQSAVDLAKIIPFFYHSQYQQRPYARGGDMIKRVWFQSETQVSFFMRFRLTPQNFTLVRYWDKAGTDTSAGKAKSSSKIAKTVGALLAREVIGIVHGVEICRYIIVDVKSAQLSFAKREELIKNTATEDAAEYGENKVETWIEREPGSSGKDVAGFTVHNLAGFRIKVDQPGANREGDKITRAQSFINQAEAGNFRYVEGDWNEPVLTALEKFPRDGKDETDSIGGAFRKLALTSRRPKKPRTITSAAF